MFKHIQKGLMLSEKENVLQQNNGNIQLTSHNHFILGKDALNLKPVHAGHHAHEYSHTHVHVVVNLCSQLTYQHVSYHYLA